MLVLAIYFYRGRREGDGGVIRATYAVSGLFALFAVSAVAVVGLSNPISWILLVTAIGVVCEFPFSHFFATMIMSLARVGLILSGLFMSVVVR